MKVMVVDDEPEICSILKRMIEKQEGFTVTCICGNFADAVSSFSKNPPDVVFMDIDLNGESGMECARVMTELHPEVKIVFATAHSEYMAGAFELYAFDYLVKPFNMERLIKTLTRMKEQSPAAKQAGQPSVHPPENRRLLIKNRERISFIDKRDIILIERQEGITLITTKDGAYQTSASLNKLEESLDMHEFIRSHKSFIINISMISGLEVYGRWTYTVHFKDTDCTALMTAEKYEEIKQII